MIYDYSQNQLNLNNFNQVLFDLASKLDKCLLLMVACGFSLNELLNEPVQNLYVKVTSQLIEKLKFYTVCVEKLSESQKNDKTEYFYKIFESQIKSLLKHISEL